MMKFTLVPMIPRIKPVNPKEVLWILFCRAPKIIARMEQTKGMTGMKNRTKPTIPSITLAIPHPVGGSCFDIVILMVSNQYLNVFF